MTRKPHAVIDGDPFVYEVGFSTTTTAEFDGDVVSVSNIADAVSKMDALIRDAVKACGALTYTVTLSDLTANWRKPIYPEYKASRKASKRPGCFGQLRAHLSKNHRAVIWPRCEADDVCGVLLTEAVFGSTVCVSIDKDMLTLPGLHFNPNKPDLGVRPVSLEEGWRNHLMQTLTGDATDGYPGCPKVGPVSALKILSDCATPGDAWVAVVAAYVARGQTEQHALVQARVAHILQAGEYDRKTGEISLWSPATTPSTVPSTSAGSTPKPRSRSPKTAAAVASSRPARSGTPRKVKGGTT